MYVICIIIKHLSLNRDESQSSLSLNLSLAFYRFIYLSRKHK